jgi:membrane protease YdiL (CAAX protease family)
MMGTLIAVVLSLTGIAAANFLLPLWLLDPQIIRNGFDERFAVCPLAAVLVVVFLSFINAALEELHFRAWLDRELSLRMGNVMGVGISAAAFGSMHALIFLGLPGFPLSLVAFAVLGLMICGICWSLLMRKPGGIHAAWWSHGLADALLLGWGLHWLGYV